jgi:uncharacterized protein YggE
MRTASPFAAALLASAAAALPVAAQTMRPEPVVRVTGAGQVRAAPDQAVADFAVETAGATAQAAAAENAQRMERVIAALVRAGVPRERIETRDYNVFPDYDPRPTETGEPRIRGYRVMNTVSATLHDIPRVGGVIDAALQAGANRVHGVRFGLRDPQRFRAQAIADAVRRARADAEAMAAALGVSLGAVREAQTAEFGMVPQPPVMYAREAMAADMAASAPTPINPSEQMVRATVVVTYAIGAATP